MRSSRIKIHGILALTLSLLTIVPVAHAARPAAAMQPQAATVRFGYAEYVVPVGDVVFVNLIVEGAETVGSWELSLTFDASKASLHSATPGAFLASTGRTVASLGPDAVAPGQEAIGGYSYGATSGVSGAGVLARLRFDALATGQTTLGLSDLLLATVDGLNVGTQPATGQDSVLLVVSALDVDISRAPNGSDVRLSWPTIPQYVSFDVWRSTQPYFYPGDLGSAVVLDETSPACSSNAGVMTCTDAGAAGNPATNYFYTVRVFNAGGQALAQSRQVAEFDFRVIPGANQ